MTHTPVAAGGGEVLRPRRGEEEGLGAGLRGRPGNGLGR